MLYSLDTDVIYFEGFVQQNAMARYYSNKPLIFCGTGTSVVWPQRMHNLSIVWIERGKRLA